MLFTGTLIRIPVHFALFSLVLMMLTGCGSSTSQSAQEAAYSPRLQQTEVSVVTVRQQSIQSDIEFTGNLLPRRVTRIVPEIDGIVREIPQIGTEFNVVVQGKKYSERLGVSFGQSVKQGDVLIQLDTRDSEVELRMAEATVKKAKADLAKIRSWERPEQIQRFTALRDQEKARYDFALNNHRRVENLSKRSVSTQSELESASMDVLTSKAALSAAEATLIQAKAGPTVEEISVQQALIDKAEAEVEQHKRTIEKATIRAPYDGVITAFQVEVGDHVSPGGNPAAELMDLRYLVAEIAVPEAYIGRVHVQDQAQIKAAGSSAPVPGLVIAINDMVDPQTRTFQVRVAIDNAHRQFKAGQFATVQLSIGKSGSGGGENLAVPNPAIVFLEGQPHVFTMIDHQVKSTPVKLGIANTQFTEIISGLKSGSVVVVDDPSLLSDGMDVTVRQNSSTAVASR